MAKMTHQADVRPACEPQNDEIVIDDESIIDLDSGVSSHHTTPAPTPEAMMVAAARVPVPSARAPSPIQMDPMAPPPITMTLLKKVIEGQQELTKAMESKMEQQEASIKRVEALHENATRELAMLKIEIKNKGEPVSD